MQELDLGWLESGEMLGLSKRAGGNLLEACLVCLNETGHESGVTLAADEMGGSVEYIIVWKETVGEQAIRSYGDLKQATEWGACGIACILINRATGLVVTRRSRQGTGFDYWLGDAEQETGSPRMFQKEAKLEVSGLLMEEKMSAIERRVREKTFQVIEGKRTDLPAFVIVVEFGRPLAKVVRLEGPDESQRIA